jgi:hypothetical protein
MANQTVGRHRDLRSHGQWRSYMTRRAARVRAHSRPGPSPNIQRIVCSTTLNSDKLNNTDASAPPLPFHTSGTSRLYEPR